MLLNMNRVLAVVQGDIVAPRPDRPTEGILSFTVEISPMASPSLEVRSIVFLKKNRQ